MFATTTKRGFFLGINGVVSIEGRTKEKGMRLGRAGRSLGTLLAIVGADGRVWMTVWIFAAAAKKTTLYDNFPDVEVRFLDGGRHKRGEWPRFYAYAPSGDTNSALHAEFIGVFSHLWHDEHKNAHCWLFGDQVGAQKCADAVADALGRGVMCWLFPANTSHFLQPLDDLVFANFKRHLKESMRAVQWSAQFTPFHFGCLLYQLAYEAEKKAFKKDVFKGAFFSTGIYPFDSSKILARTAAYAEELKSESRFEFPSAMRSSVDDMLQARSFSDTLVTSKVTVEKKRPVLVVRAGQKGGRNQREAGIGGGEEGGG